MRRTSGANAARRSGALNAANVTPAAMRQREVLTKALVNSATVLNMGQRDLADLAGVSATTIGRFKRGEQVLRQDSKAWGVAVMLVEVCQLLAAMVGGSEIHMRAWMTSRNLALNAAPADALRSVEGLVRLLGYLRNVAASGMASRT